jgi:hypothetical protein
VVEKKLEDDTPLYNKKLRINIINKWFLFDIKSFVVFRLGDLLFVHVKWRKFVYGFLLKI